MENLLRKKNHDLLCPAEDPYKLPKIRQIMISVSCINVVPPAKIVTTNQSLLVDIYLFLSHLAEFVCRR